MLIESQDGKIFVDSEKIKEFHIERNGVDYYGRDKFNISADSIILEIYWMPYDCVKDILRSLIYALATIKDVSKYIKMPQNDYSVTVCDIDELKSH